MRKETNEHPKKEWEKQMRQNKKKKKKRHKEKCSKFEHYSTRAKGNFVRKSKACFPSNFPNLGR